MGRILGAFWTILAGFWGFERRPILKPKLEAEKVISRPRKGSRPDSLAALILIVDQPIIDNVDRRSLKIVDRWTLTSLNSLRSVNKHAHFVPRKLGHGGGFFSSSSSSSSSSSGSRKSAAVVDERRPAHADPSPSREEPEAMEAEVVG